MTEEVVQLRQKYTTLEANYDTLKQNFDEVRQNLNTQSQVLETKNREFVELHLKLSMAEDQTAFCRRLYLQIVALRNFCQHQQLRGTR